MIIPHGICAVEIYDRIFKANILDICFVLEKKPVGYFNLETSRIQEGVSFLVFHQHTFQVHFIEIEKPDPDMSDGDMCLQVMGKSPRHLPGQPVLSRFRLQEAPAQHDQDQQAK